MLPTSTLERMLYNVLKFFPGRLKTSLLTGCILLLATFAIADEYATELILSDSTKLRVSMSNLPDATPDFAIVVINNKLVFDLMENDRIPGNLLSIGIDEPPQFGNACFNADNSLTYEPLKNICEETDIFTYVVVNEYGSDTVEVAIEIICEYLTFMSGISPDGDGVFDTFTIIGVENFPDNILYIFNDAGQEVYFKRGYQNEWDGKIDGKFPERDSMFYYVFSDGKGNTYSGYLQMTI